MRGERDAATVEQERLTGDAWALFVLLHGGWRRGHTRRALRAAARRGLVARPPTSTASPGRSARPGRAPSAATAPATRGWPGWPRWRAAATARRWRTSPMCSGSSRAPRSCAPWASPATPGGRRPSPTTTTTTTRSPPAADARRARRRRPRAALDRPDGAGACGAPRRPPVGHRRACRRTRLSPGGVTPGPTSFGSPGAGREHRGSARRGRAGSGPKGRAATPTRRRGASPAHGQTVRHAVAPLPGPTERLPPRGRDRPPPGGIGRARRPPRQRGSASIRSPSRGRSVTSASGSTRWPGARRRR